jgi:hypothetical protein
MNAIDKYMYVTRIQNLSFSDVLKSLFLNLSQTFALGIFISQTGGDVSFLATKS